ncbi:reverse transcriptase domain-containing protein [Tanacetum coccineum]
MRTRSQTRNRNHQQQAPPAVVKPFNLEEPFDNPPLVPMADNQTMAELLQAPTEGYEDAIVILEINANFELKHGLINLVQNKQFFGHDKKDPHAHIRYFNKITSTMRFLDIPSTSIKLMLFPFSLEELHQLDTFYNALNANDQDSLNSAAGGNFLDKMPHECLKIIESKSKVRNSRNKAVVAKDLRTPLVPTPVVSTPLKEPERNPETSMDKVQKPVPKKLEDPGKFIIPCALQELDRTNALADSGASINLLPLSIYKQLGLGALKPTRMGALAACYSIIDFSKDEQFSDSTTIHSGALLPKVCQRRSSPVKTSDNLLEEFADEFTLPNPFPLGNDDSILKKDVHEENFQIYSNSLFKFEDNFNSTATKILSLTWMEEDVENENSKVFDEPVLPHTPFSNKVECFNPGGDNDKIDAFLAIEVPIHIEGYFDSEGDLTYLKSLLSDDTTPNLSPKEIFDHEPQQLRNEPENEPLITFSPKSDPLHHEFTVIHLPSHRENSHTIIESLPTSTTHIEDSDPNREEIDIFSRPDDSIPPGVESDFDSEEDIIDNLLNNDSTRERLTFNIEPDAPVIHNVDEINEHDVLTPGEVRLMLMKGLDNPPSHLSLGFSFHISLTPRFLPYCPPPEMRIPFLTPASPLRAGGISSGWDFHVV